MRTTTRDIERQIGALEREIEELLPALNDADQALERWACTQRGEWLKTRWAYFLERRRERLSPLFARLNALKARLPKESQIKPQTMEALLCLMDHVEDERRYAGRRGVAALMGR